MSVAIEWECDYRVAYGETLSVEKPLQGGMVFKERMSLWRDSSRREKLRGEPVREVAI
jgi:hypothetical protein